MSEYKAGIIGASSWIARELMEWMEKWRFQVALTLMDDQEACGRIIKYQASYLPIKLQTEEQIKECDIIFDCRSEITEEISGMKENAYIISLGGCHKQYKVILPSINLTEFHKEDHHILIPCASYILLASVLSLMQQLSDVSRAVITSLHSVAELGDEACQDLMQQIQSYAKGQEIESTLFPIKDAYQHLPLLFQTLPQTSCLCEAGDTCEELFLKEHLKDSVTHVPELCATCVRVAALRGLSMSLVLTCEKEQELDTIIDAFASDPKFICIDDISHNMYPICADVIHDYRIYIGRMRKSDPHTFATWAVCDDLAIRCGAAVKIAMYILRNFLPA